jgi:hypothetical protein
VTLSKEKGFTKSTIKKNDLKKVSLTGYNTLTKFAVREGIRKKEFFL